MQETTCLPLLQSLPFMDTNLNAFYRNTCYPILNYRIAGCNTTSSIVGNFTSYTQ